MFVQVQIKLPDFACDISKLFHIATRKKRTVYCKFCYFGAVYKMAVSLLKML